MITTAAEALAKVKEYYGTLTKEKQSLKSKACCSADSLAPMLRDIVDMIEPEILDRFYGCGSPIPAALEGCSVLDLGCGTGRDAYLVSKLVGEEGCVIGVDMTEEQLKEFHLADVVVASSEAEEAGTESSGDGEKDAIRRGQGQDGDQEDGEIAEADAPEGEACQEEG